MSDISYVRGIRDVLNYYVLEGLTYHGIQSDLLSRTLIEGVESLRGISPLLELSTWTLRNELSEDERKGFDLPPEWYITQGQFDRQCAGAINELRGTPDEYDCDAIKHALSLRLLNLIQGMVDEMKAAKTDATVRNTLCDYAWN